MCLGWSGRLLLRVQVTETEKHMQSTQKTQQSGFCCYCCFFFFLYPAVPYGFLSSYMVLGSDNPEVHGRYLAYLPSQGLCGTEEL